MDALDETKNLAIAMKEALLRGELTEFGELLHSAWLHKKKFSDRITNPDINKMYEKAREAGALGGKLLGAGGGGYFLFSGHKPPLPGGFFYILKRGLPAGS